MIIYQKWIKRDDLVANPTLLYIFGDNANRIGFGGQAAHMRGEHNAHGIATLWSPGIPFSDHEYEDVCQIIDTDLTALAAKVAPSGIGTTAFDGIVFPIDGVGTGLANMVLHCPQAKEYLDAQLLKRLGIKNGLSLWRVEFILHESTAPGETDG